jgi:hypothetical protein
VNDTRRQTPPRIIQQLLAGVVAACGGGALVLLLLLPVEGFLAMFDDTGAYTGVLGPALTLCVFGIPALAVTASCALFAILAYAPWKAIVAAILVGCLLIFVVTHLEMIGMGFKAADMAISFVAELATHAH